MENQISTELEKSIDAAAEAFANSLRVQEAKDGYKEYLEEDVAEGVENLNELKGIYHFPVIDDMLELIKKIKDLLNGFIDGTDEKDLDTVNEEFKELIDKYNKMSMILLQRIIDANKH